MNSRENPQAPTGMSGSSITDAVWANVDYLMRDPKHDEEKPYLLGFDAEGIIPQTNMKDEPHLILIQNFRPHQSPTDFAQFGFTLRKIDYNLKAADFQDRKQVREALYPRILKLLGEIFPGAAAIKIIEHDTRKRDPEFTGKETISRSVQPATRVHSDYSLNSADLTARAFFKEEARGYQRLVTVNCWASFQGPGNDWPLALCDARTIQHSLESISADRVFHDRLTENQRFYYSPNHKWYYFKDLTSNEVLVFRQTDSDLQEGGGVAHTSFYNSDTDLNAAPRESVEVRAFVFYK